MLVKLFFCYAHEDEALLIRLKTHLKPLERQGLIEIWYDREINAGTEWEQEISQHLNEAQIILLLVSPDFMNSEYCNGTELKRALERHKRGEALVVPVIGRPAYWQGTLGQLQALPKDAISITDPDWHDQDRALHNVTESLHKIVDLTLSSQKNPEEKAQRSVFPIQNLASPSASTPSPNPFMTALQSSPQSSSAVTPLSIPSSFFEAQRETEMFEKDLIFEEYISKRVQQDTIPSRWHIYRPSHIEIIKCGIMLGFIAAYCSLFVWPLLVAIFASGAQGSRAVLLVLLCLLIIPLSGGITCEIYRRHELQKKQRLILTPNGCILFQNGQPYYIFRYSKVKQIQFSPSNKVLTVKTNNLGDYKMSLKSFKTPRNIAESIESAHTLFITNNYNSTAR